jgi:hypothetical protein
MRRTRCQQDDEGDSSLTKTCVMVIVIAGLLRFARLAKTLTVLNRFGTRKNREDVTKLSRSAIRILQTFVVLSLKALGIWSLTAKASVVVGGSGHPDATGFRTKLCLHARKTGLAKLNAM